MASGNSLPQVNLSVQGGNQGGSHNLIYGNISDQGLRSSLRQGDRFMPIVSRSILVTVRLGSVPPQF
ncbi:hypothetical protein TNCV_4637551 [Trichonephila clavipes]|nr:hypothetical protein TNCV_4637551 [Trichonephila clavipes]